MPNTKTRVNVADSMPVRTQFLFFTLLGDYVLPSGGEIWTSSLVCLMGLLDVSERAVRSTLSRMTRKGWIATEKHGRRSKYKITPHGRSLLEQGQARIFEPIFTDWDGTWHMVVYSLPEKVRRLRHELRKQLTWLGFGSLAPGTWISPHDRRDELENLFVTKGVEPYVELFSGVHLGPSSNRELVDRCWNLEELQEAYQDFADRYQPMYEKLQTQFEQNQSPSAQDCFIDRFWITHEFQAIPLKDPNLPTALLPSDWIGFTARQLLENYRDLLGQYANQSVHEIICGDGRPPNG